MKPRDLICGTCGTGGAITYRYHVSRITPTTCVRAHVRSHYLSRSADYFEVPLDLFFSFFPVKTGATNQSTPIRYKSKTCDNRYQTKQQKKYPCSLHQTQTILIVAWISGIHRRVVNDTRNGVDAVLVELRHFHPVSQKDVGRCETGKPDAQDINEILAKTTDRTCGRKPTDRAQNCNESSGGHLGVVVGTESIQYIGTGFPRVVFQVVSDVLRHRCKFTGDGGGGGGRHAHDDDRQNDHYLSKKG